VRLALAFFASGAAGLLFEVLWFRALGRALGNTVWAATVVLTAFMLGIAIGALVAARWSPRHPGRAFAAAELTVAIAGTAVVWALPALESTIAQGLAPLAANGTVLAAARLLIALLALLAPTIAMGMTLPFGVRMLADRETTRALGMLYAANTLGACVAPMTAEFLLIEALGLRGTALAAASLNLLAATLALLHPVPRLPPRLDRPSAPTVPWRLLSVAAGAGALALALEVIWFRLLLLHAAPTDASFALMLMLMLLGVALGGAAASLMGRRRPAWIVAATGAAVVLGYWMASPAETVAGMLRYAVPLMIPACVLSGALFTVLGAMLRSDVPDPRPAIARLTSANTLGAALGAAVGGLALLPRAGIEGSLFLIAAGYALLTLLLVAGGSWRAWLPSAAALAVLALFPFGLMKSHLAQAAHYFLAAHRADVVSVTEGPVTTLQVLKFERFGQPHRWRLLTDSYSMSGIERDALRYMQLFAWLPLALHPAPRRALLISYGAGVTAQALLDEKSLDRLTIVDLSPEILAASATLHPEGDPLRDPRVQLVLEDGRHFLFSRSEQFDLITGEPPPPGMAGVVNLYSAEYFSALAKRLARGGLATYWLPVHQFAPRGARAVIAAWCSAFPDCSLWAGTGREWVLFGGREFAHRPDLVRIARLWEDPASAPRLAASGFEHPAQLGAAFIADAAQLQAWISGTPPLTDDYPKRIAAPPLPGQTTADEYSPWMAPQPAHDRFAASSWVARHWPQDLREQTLQFFSVQPILNGAHVPDSARMATVDWLLRGTGLQVPVYWLLDSDIEEQRILERLPHRREHAYARGVRALAERDYPRAAAFFLEAGERKLEAYARCRAGSAQASCG
jgi:predicted membrane-bound spermidine synthase